MSNQGKPVGTSKRKNKPNRRSGRDYSVGAMARVAAAHVIESFRSLPRWSQKDTVASLFSEFPHSFEGIRIESAAATVKTVSVADSPRVPLKSALKRKKEKDHDDTGKSVKSTDSAAVKTAPKVDSVKSPPNPVQDSGKKPDKESSKAFQRPVVSGLDVSRRLSKMTSAERAEAKEDQALLSAALAAANRGRRENIEESALKAALEQTRESKSSFARLWPSLNVRRGYVLKRARKDFKIRKDTKPQIQQVGDKLIVVGSRQFPDLVPGGFLPSEDDEQIVNHPVKIGLPVVPFHDEKFAQLEVTPASVCSFFKSEKGNYKAFDSNLHILVDGRFCLYWLPKSCARLGWGDEDGDIEVMPSPSPRTRKKRRIDEGKDNN